MLKCFNSPWTNSSSSLVVIDFFLFFSTRKDIIIIYFCRALLLAFVSEKKKSPCLTELACFISGIQWQWLMQTTAAYRVSVPGVDLSHIQSSRWNQGHLWVHVPGSSWPTALGAWLEAGSRASRSGQPCLYICILQACSGVGFLTSVCTAHTAWNSLPVTGIASLCLLEKENCFGLLLAKAKVTLCWLCLETACPLQSVHLLV